MAGDRDRKKHSFRRSPRASLALGAAAVLAALAVLFLVLRTADDRAGGGLWDGRWYWDDLGRIESDTPLLRGMRAYEKRTGVRPCLWLTAGVDPEALDDLVRDRYRALFDGEDCLLAVYDEWEEGVYFLSAQAAEGLLETEDIAQLLDAIERAYADPENLTYADAFGAGFRQAAEAFPQPERSIGAAVLAVMGTLIVILSAILTFMLRRRAREIARERALYLMEDG